jgi:hypothetical protein
LYVLFFIELDIRHVHLGGDRQPGRRLGHPAGSQPVARAGGAGTTHALSCCTTGTRSSVAASTTCSAPRVPRCC